MWNFLAPSRTVRSCGAFGTGKGQEAPKLVVGSCGLLLGDEQWACACGLGCVSGEPCGFFSNFSWLQDELHAPRLASPGVEQVGTGAERAWEQGGWPHRLQPPMP